jgi:hypothetical protein
MRLAERGPVTIIDYIAEILCVLSTDKRRIPPDVPPQLHGCWQTLQNGSGHRAAMGWRGGWDDLVREERCTACNPGFGTAGLRN